MNEKTHSRLFGTARCASAALLLLAFAGGARAECPSVDHVSKAIQQLTKQKSQLEITRVVPSAIDGICEVHGKTQLGGNQVLYMDAAGAHLFNGTIMEVATGRNLTEETRDTLNVFAPEDYAKLEALTAVTLGDRGAPLYLVTGSQDPYLAKVAPILRELAGAGAVQVRVLMFPLPNRKTERDQCVSVICDKKGFDALESGYRSENICTEGARVVDQSVELLKSNGVFGTPSYILPDGRLKVGFREAAALRQFIDSSAAPAKSSPTAPAAK